MQLRGSGEWTYPALIRLARDEGISGMYKGFAPKVLRLAPGGGVLLLVVELLSGSTFFLPLRRGGLCESH